MQTTQEKTDAITKWQNKGRLSSGRLYPHGIEVLARVIWTKFQVLLLCFLYCELNLFTWPGTTGWTAVWGLASSVDGGPSLRLYGTRGGWRSDSSVAPLDLGWSYGGPRGPVAHLQPDSSQLVNDFSTTGSSLRCYVFSSKSQYQGFLVFAENCSSPRITLFVTPDCVWTENGHFLSLTSLWMRELWEALRGFYPEIISSKSSLSLFVYRTISGGENISATEQETI